MQGVHDTYMYCIPLVHEELIAALETAGNAPMKAYACLEARHSDWGSYNTMSE